MSAAAAAPWRVEKGCVIVRVRVTPKSSKDEMDGVAATSEGAGFKARVRAPPENGKANAAVERLLVDALDLPRGAVRLASGARSRLKTLVVDGEPDEIERRLAEMLVALGR